ncbi:molybdenum cofactor synthesis domain-containing protein [Castellaniella sp.]|uniref:molybdenum cofactor synthesis domain-containing protein n=1 Tax=Castellaniella sp. TaxID=1955812 RepID=UPI002AFF0A29|nr:molybdenum cofactor synthesis domain-containing protein [Castellaniella sp.]
MKADPSLPAVSLHCAVLTISSRRTTADDSSGDYLSTALQDAGHILHTRGLCVDDRYQIRKVLSDWIADPAIEVIICNGGTGFTHEKSTIAAVSPLLDQAIPGFGELFRHLSWLDIGSSALQSDALGGTANHTLVFCLPGSTGACHLAWEKILQPQLNSRQPPCNFASAYRRHA